MSLIPHEPENFSRSAIGSYFDWQGAAELRNMALRANLGTPAYLLAPEVAVLLGYFADLHQRLLMETLWNTGARINEALPITPADIELGGGRPFIVLRTLKQRRRKPGRPTKVEQVQGFDRAIPLSDQTYTLRLREYLATFKPKRHEPLWPITDDTARNWLTRAVESAQRDGIAFRVNPVTTKTFRHSYAMHLIQHGVPLKVVQAFMGHKELKSTEVYTKVFSLEVGQQFGVRFSMDAADARQLITTIPDNSEGAFKPVPIDIRKEILK
ncbi:putative resolvase/recombinase [Yersinia intermedia]|uniref:tyrosine-type recombinase/integrase n=1 Tax=Yersinia intermedia TaxID=631 RepID=UPI0005DD1AA0|nr:tyrosine-type recombinase/integrase [Yersinia intermedia]CND13390.1 putative resolvase/recombinase [Yersinia intermedia]CNH39178.1 putative resolvase/recombinase [Yersinia intermedia]